MQSRDCAQELAELREEFAERMNMLQNRMLGLSFENDIRAELRFIRAELRNIREVQNDMLIRMNAPPAEGWKG